MTQAHPRQNRSWGPGEPERQQQQQVAEKRQRSGKKIGRRDRRDATDEIDKIKPGRWGEGSQVGTEPAAQAS
ncbi:hypothetical protein N7462_000870 [Penicillium macrosclerotiorum]|uniref:uncharacterized protein n=1 Tax=Penicillium macrosclerotiorum TaxID=303699 RepID=UPI00254971F8|nr:uncharacterized protein N7462_000870 [Penicillium macrosclerotiorum]KAJ5698865.1 hypothetical protein N7462_000870 [Penicillium macrosclerotiorum]